SSVSHFGTDSPLNTRPTVARLHPIFCAINRKLGLPAANRSLCSSVCNSANETATFGLSSRALPVLAGSPFVTSLHSDRGLSPPCSARSPRKLHNRLLEDWGPRHPWTAHFSACISRDSRMSIPLVLKIDSA